MEEYRNFITKLSLPYLGTPSEAIPKIFETLNEKFGLKHNSSQQIIDLGSGNGRIIIFSAINYGIKSVGIEIDSTLIEEANHSIKMLKNDKKISRKCIKLIEIKKEDLFLQNLQEFDFIYIYSLPSMQRSLNHVFLTAKSQAVIISFNYELNGFESYLNYEYCLDIKYGKKIWKAFFYRKR